jgi:type III pantothenate kinase
MNLVIDIGNTLLKYAVFDGEKNIYQGVNESLDFFPGNFFNENKGIEKAIVSSVREIPENLLKSIKSFCPLHILDTKTRLPFKNLYKTPETLGNDRIAGLAGAYSIYPGKDVLIIDAGTCITMDLLHAGGEYFGGTISPGLVMKLNALHTFTGKLPLVTLREFEDTFGPDTETSILAGIINGTIAEIDQAIGRFKNKYPGLVVLMCGGDASFLAKRLKNSIFAVPDLVLLGLNELLDYNEC